MTSAPDGFMDGSFVAVIVCFVLMAAWALLTVGPSCPDSEKEPEKAPEEMGRAMAGLFGVLLLTVIMIVLVFQL